MDAEIKSLHLLGEWNEFNLSEEFYSNVEIEIGPKGKNVSDLFNVNVCNYKFIENNARKKGIAFPGKIFVTDRFDELFLVDFISKKISVVHGENWEDLAGKLALIFNWEYDDYT